MMAMVRRGTLCILYAIVCAGAGAAEVIVNVPYLDGADYADDKDKLDLYLPDGEGAHPVMIFIHGGGLLAGDKKQYGFVGNYFSSQGFLTVVVNHRLSPGVSHPAHIEDVAASFAWVKKNIAQHGGDSRRIFVTGHSAGAYLVGLLATDSRYLGRHGLDLSALAGAVPISGFFHVERLAPGRPKTVWGTDPSAWPAASPARYATAQGPPMLLIYADGDVPERRKESEDMAAALRTKGRQDVSTVEIAGRDHVSIARKLGSEGDETAARILSFMRRVLDGRTAR